MGKSGKTSAIILLCGLIGVAFAIFIQLLNDAGILVDEFITASLTLREVQLVVIIFWFMIGIGVSAIDR